MKSFAFAAIVKVALAGKYNTIGAPCRIRNPNRAEPRIHTPLVLTNLPESWEWRKIIGTNFLTAGDEASKVYDMALYVLGIFYVIEWIRTTILLAIICIGANLLPLWYASAISAPFAIGVIIYAHVVYASDDSKACAVVELIYFWTLFWIYQVPMLLIRF